MALPLWTVILAAGAGRRLSGVTGGVPKQFWRGTRGRSLLENTVERFAPLAPASRTVAVIDAAHRNYLLEGAVPGSVGTTIVQPEDRGTAAGVLLALMPVLDSGSDALVAITPSDHGVVNDARFRSGVLEAARYARPPRGMVVFGVQPVAAHDDYGWITPGSFQSSRSLRAVASFVEKPNAQEAARLLESGAVWNTMVVVARVRAIQDLCAELLPELAGVFEAASRMPPSERHEFFAGVYPCLPRFDFSRDVLAPARNLSTYIWPTSVGWSDLGTPERLREWQSRAETSRQPTGAITAA